MPEHLGNYMANVKGELKLISKHSSMVTTQVEQVLKAQNDLLNELNSNKNDYAVKVATRTGRMTQEPLYPEGRENIWCTGAYGATGAPSSYCAFKMFKKF